MTDEPSDLPLRSELQRAFVATYSQRRDGVDAAGLRDGGPRLTMEGDELIVTLAHPVEPLWRASGRIGTDEVTMTLAEAVFWDFLRTDDPDEVTDLAGYAVAWLIDATNGRITTTAVYRGEVLHKSMYEWKTSFYGNRSGTHRPGGWITRPRLRRATRTPRTGCRTSSEQAASERCS